MEEPMWETSGKKINWVYLVGGTIIAFLTLDLILLTHQNRELKTIINSTPVVQLRYIQYLTISNRNKTMKSFILAMVALLAGCAVSTSIDHEGILHRSPDTWSEQEALSVLISAVGHNLLDQQTNIKVIATPYYPSVITAMKRYAQLRKHLSEEEFQTQVDELAKDALGMYVDWEKGGKYADSKLNYLKGKHQFDSLLFLVTLENLAWSSVSSYAGVLVGPEHVYIPYITDLEQRISLFNERGDELKPRYVAGRNKTSLTIKERIFVMFQLHNANRHFLEGSNKMHLLIKGFEKPIKLEFDLKYMQ